LVRRVSGVPADLIRGAARLYATGGNAAIYYGLGVTEHSQGTTTVMAIANLAMATGNIGRPGVGVNPLRGQNNVQGSCDNLVRKVTAPRNGMADWEITLALAKALGFPVHYDHPSEIMDEIARVTPTFAGVPYDLLDEVGSVQWPCSEKAPTGTPVMHMGGAGITLVAIARDDGFEVFTHAGRIEIAAVEHVA
jgi:predicted molibdopterin-dependent oxidoreductase YjgC